MFTLYKFSFLFFLLKAKLMHMSPKHKLNAGQLSMDEFQIKGEKAISLAKGGILGRAYIRI
jgi:hypothetical protein